MRKTIFYVLILFIIPLFICFYPLKDHLPEVRIPGEWEEQEAVWMGFRTRNSFGFVFDSITIPLVQVLQDRISLNLMVENKKLLPDDRNFFNKQGINPNKVKVVYQDPTHFWYRDPGPIFAHLADGGLAVVNFDYNRYLKKESDEPFGKNRNLDKIDEDVAKKLGLLMIPVNIVMEGGAFETNGNGVAIQVEPVTLGRNPGLDKPYIESELQKAGIQKVIWLPFGMAEDPDRLKIITGNYYGWGTGGHVDEFARFANENTILLAWIRESEKDQHPIKRINYERMQQNLKILQQATDMYGKPFRIIKVPVPEIMTEEKILDQEDVELFAEHNAIVQAGDTLLKVACTSYLNYLITNNTVLVPAYGEEGRLDPISLKDEQVYKLFRQLYPEREIIQVNPIILNWYGGGMHCLVQTQPKAGIKTLRKIY